MKPPVALPVLLAAARALVWSRFDAVAHVGTLDGLHYEACALDEEGARVDACPVGRATSDVGAVQTLIDALHLEGVRVDAARVAALRTLAEAYPAGVTWQPGADVDDDQAVALERAAG